MACFQCGADTPSGANRCGSCGAHLDAIVVDDEAPSTQAAAPSQLAPAAHDIPSHMPFAIVATLMSVVCCCLPFGMLAIIPAAMVSGRVEQGNLSAAKTLSGVALGWSLLTMIVSIGSIAACMGSSFSALGMVRAFLGV